MLKHAIIILAVLVPQLTFAADLRMQRRHHVARQRSEPVVVRSKVFTCTTTDFVIVAYSNCGQGLDPLAFSGY